MTPQEIEALLAQVAARQAKFEENLTRAERRYQQSDERHERRLHEADERYERRLHEADERYERRYREAEERHERRHREAMKRLDRLEALAVRLMRAADERWKRIEAKHSVLEDIMMDLSRTQRTVLEALRRYVGNNRRRT